MTTPETPEPSRWRERSRSWVLNVLVLDGLSILGTALAVRRWAPIEVDVDLGRLKLGLLGALFACFVLARIMLRAPGVRAHSADSDTRARVDFRARVATAAAGWFALPLGLAYGLTIDPTLGGLAPFWVTAMLLGTTALPRRSDLEAADEHATEPDA